MWGNQFYKEPIQKRFESKFIPEPMSGCWLWIGTTCWGRYGCFSIRGESKSAHHISWEIYKGYIPNGLCVLHKCDTPFCVNPEHLFLGTFKDNTQDSIKKGRKCCGDKSPNSKLTNEDVIKIRKDVRSERKIAKDYNVSSYAVRCIKINKTWKHI